MARPKEAEWVKVQVRLQKPTFTVIERIAKGMGMTPNMVLRLMVQQTLPMLETLAGALEQRASGSELGALTGLFAVAEEMRSLQSEADVALKSQRDAFNAKEEGQ